MNGISKGKKHISNLERGISYKSFVSAEKSRLRTAYPFLSQSQINGKIKKKWKMLDQTKRAKFSKWELEVTSSKGRTSSKTKRSTAKQKENSFDVWHTPEKVNLHRLSDFRKQHKECYKNDFGADKSSSHTLLLSRQTIGRVSDGNDTEAKEMDTNNTESPDLDMDESDEDNDGVLIRRKDFDEYSDIEDSANAVEDSCNINKKIEKVTTDTDNENNSGTRGKDFKNSNNTITPNEFVDCRKNTIMVKDKAAENFCDKSSDDNFLRYPGHQRPATKKLSGIKKRHSAPPSNLPAVLTPLVINSNEETEKYTTPQMDEVLQKLTIHEVNKAPQKRRHTYESVDTIEKIKATVSGRHVTRSLLPPQSDSNETVEEKFEDTGVSEGIIATDRNNKQVLDKHKKNAKLSLRNKNNLRIRDENNNTSQVLDEKQNKVQCTFEENKTKSGDMIKEVIINDTKSFLLKGSKDLTGNTIQMNPTGDASQTDQENMEINLEKQSDVIDDDHDDNKGDSKKRQKRKLMIINSNQNVKKKKEQMAVSTEECRSHGTKMKDDQSSSVSQSSQEFASSPATSSWSFTPLRKTYRYTDSSNPTLEKVLEGLRSTKVTSQTWSCSNSNISSPRLLSPALSGVSELSSLSDQCSSEKEKQDKDDCMKIIKIEENSLDLCDLFKDVTPPELKTKGLYKTTRMLKSGNQDEKSDFKQLFQNEDMDTIFI